MSRHFKPYLRCTKLDGVMRLTLMGGARNGHRLWGRREVPLGDSAAFAIAIEEMLFAARAGKQSLEKQADGDS